MSPDQHREVADTVEHLLKTIRILAGLPEDTPGCFAKRPYDPTVRKEVNDYIKWFAAKQIEYNPLEIQNNPAEAKKFNDLINVIINSLEG